MVALWPSTEAPCRIKPGMQLLRVLFLLVPSIVTVRSMNPYMGNLLVIYLESVKNFMQLQLSRYISVNYLDGG